MTIDKSNVSHAELAELLLEQTAAGVTGTVFVRTGSGQLGSFGLRNGKLVSVLFRGMPGRRAVQRLAQAGDISVRFDGTQVMGEGGKTPDCNIDEVVATLGNGAAAAVAAGAPAAAPGAPPAPGGANGEQALDATTLDFLRMQAADALGPMGPLVLDDLLARHGASRAGASAAADAFSREIGNTDAARRFMDSVSGRLSV